MKRLASLVTALALAPAAFAQTLGEPVDAVAPSTTIVPGDYGADSYSGASYGGASYGGESSAAPAASAGSGDDSSSDLAKKLANPVSSMVSVPFQYNYNSGFGEDGDGSQNYVNIQPVMPFSISEKWNVISRTILPVVWQEGVVPGEDHQFGLGSTTQSFFFSPKQPTAGGLIWGAGPAFLIPTGTDRVAPNQWGAGITGVALKQTGPWTVGLLANQIWSLTSDSRYGDYNQAFVQPFLSYTTPKATTFTLNTESTYDWETSEWSVPINATVAQIVKAGPQTLQIGAGARYWADTPEGGPDGWGARPS